VVIAGRRDALCDLFTTIEALMQVLWWETGEGAAPAGNFLGFTVADLDVIRYEPGAQDRDDASLLAARGSLA
jgi:hypothetical protein